MSFRFHPDETTAAGIRRVAGERLDRAIHALHDPPQGDLTGAVHGARKEFKRLRALLRLTRPALGGKRFAQENTGLRDAGRALSAVRDSQVLGAAFDRLIGEEPTAAGSGSVTAETVAKVRAGLARHAKTTAKAAALAERVSPVLAELRATRRRAKRWPLGDDGGSGGSGDDHGDGSQENHDGGDGDWCLVGEGLQASYRQGRAALAHVEKAGGALDAPWHELRKRVKDLGYQLRLLRPLWPHEVKTWVAECDAAADRLGDEHDLLVLRELILKSARWATASERSALVTLVDARRRRLQGEARELARRLYLEKPARFGARLRHLWRLWRDDTDDKDKPRE